MAARLRSTRRNFLKQAAGATAAFAAPLVLPQSVFGANERIAVAFIGVKNQGTNNLKGFLKQDVAIPAICDVDSTVAGTAVDLLKKSGHTAETFGDYRRLLDRKDFDAVVVTVPDHWHALITIDAC